MARWFPRRRTGKRRTALICDVGGHDKAGMHADLTVR
jgi:uncharacterized cupredoxin-like copper-binding protein